MPTHSRLENRKRAFVKIQQLHKEVRSRIDKQIAKHQKLSPLEPHGLEKEKIFWAFMESQGELGAGNPLGSTQTNPLNLRSILAPVAETTIAHEPQPKMGFRHCPYPRCNWKIEDCKKSWSLFENHVQVGHRRERFRCEAGCTKNFPSKKSRHAHEINVHGIKVDRCSVRKPVLQASKRSCRFCK